MIAISYRREDSMPIAGRLYDRLQAQFGKQNVFMDFDSIPPGVDFRERIKETIERSNLVIAVIGPGWLGEQSDGSRRIDDPTDFVRLEIDYALKAGIPVIPLLVNGTPMPKPEKLPRDIEALAFRNALPLDSGLDFHSHTDRLINGVCSLIDVEREQPLPPSAPTVQPLPLVEVRSRLTPFLVAFFFIIVAIFVLGIWFEARSKQKTQIPASPTSERMKRFAGTWEGELRYYRYDADGKSLLPAEGPFVLAIDNTESEVTMSPRQDPSEPHYLKGWVRRDSRTLSRKIEGDQLETTITVDETGQELTFIDSYGPNKVVHQGTFHRGLSGATSPSTPSDREPAVLGPGRLINEPANLQPTPPSSFSERESANQSAPAVSTMPASSSPTPSATPKEKRLFAGTWEGAFHWTVYTKDDGNSGGRSVTGAMERAPGGATPMRIYVNDSETGGTMEYTQVRGPASPITEFRRIDPHTLSNGHLTIKLNESGKSATIILMSANAKSTATGKGSFQRK